MSRWPWPKPSARPDGRATALERDQNVAFKSAIASSIHWDRRHGTSSRTVAPTGPGMSSACLGMDPASVARAGIVPRAPATQRTDSR
jgi:hypothetical protein